MDIGICVPSHIGDTDYIVRAEELGYSHAWLADSQMIWSDCYATLALAAYRTSTIHLGTGVAITGTRPASVNAAGIATINALAPGRTFFGVGAGNTAMRVMGLPPQRIAKFDSYLEELAPLLRGEESLLNHQGEQIPIKHIMPDKGFVTKMKQLTQLGLNLSAARWSWRRCIMLTINGGILVTNRQTQCLGFGKNTRSFLKIIRRIEGINGYTWDIIAGFCLKKKSL